MLSEKLNGGTGKSVVLAGSIDFDGANDYLSRGDLTGNTDGKTFTFSFWAWQYGGYVYTADQTYFRVQISANTVKVSAQNTAGTYILDATTVTVVTPRTWMHIVISIDLTNAANRSIYINDTAASVTWTTYTNDTIDFTRTTQQVAANSTPGYTGRLAHVYFDKTYRDLSVAANRRLFVTADLKSAAGQAALNPIVYLPMSDPTQPGKNSGTGGDFTLTGVVARSGRGPNQYNAPFCFLNGSTQYLTRATLTGATNTNKLTANFVFNRNIATQDQFAFSSTSANPGIVINIAYAANNGFYIAAYNSAGTLILQAYASNFFTVGRNYVVTISLDLSNTANRFVFINGVNQTSSLTWSTYTNDNINFQATTNTVAGNGTNFVSGKMGAFWFNNTYTDLSVATNLAKFVTGTGVDAKPVDPGANGELPTGTSPLIYLPMFGNDAGQNRGTGGAFTANGPYTGYRSSNEFFANKALFGTTAYFSKTSAVSSLTTARKGAISLFVTQTSSLYDNNDFISIVTSGGAELLRFNYSFDTTVGGAFFRFGGSYFSSVSLGALALGTHHFCLHWDTTLGNNASGFSLYVNGVLKATGFTSLTSADVDLSSGNRVALNALFAGGAFTKGAINGTNYSELYFTTSYIDFSQEANRLKFCDTFGYPTDLPSAIVAGTVPIPSVYMRFDPASFGTNSGTGGNFTVNNTITDGGQF